MGRRAGMLGPPGSKPETGKSGQNWTIIVSPAYRVQQSCCLFALFAMLAKQELQTKSLENIGFSVCLHVCNGETVHRMPRRALTRLAAIRPG